MKTLIIGSGSGPRPGFSCRSSGLTGPCRGTQLCECRWQEHRRGPGRNVRFHCRDVGSEGFLTAANALTVVVAVAAMLPSATLAQDARVGEDRWGNDTANVVEPTRCGLDATQDSLAYARSCGYELGRNSASMVVPRRTGCFEQREEARRHPPGSRLTDAEGWPVEAAPRFNMFSSRTCRAETLPAVAVRSSK